MTRTRSDLRVGRDVEATEQLVDRIAGAASKCPGVAELSPGPAATYLPHRTVPGVVVGDGTAKVAIVARYGRPLVEIADEVRAAVRRVVPDLRVDVIIEDLEAEGT